ncbi:hypothetical protein [Paenibacillus agri]|uniref:Uncharacterized protein n=1 Tax=Paenibacillus agri TaxID=2744309 RepID=A0A850ETW0_9BACL|nr:hypothetical protein [Paenibacillus agri]NUU62784.1 hypothetical protein [Paenibacillus agri]
MSEKREKVIIITVSSQDVFLTTVEQEVENKINSWLSNNKRKNVKNIQLSASGDKANALIWYEE